MARVHGPQSNRRRGAARRPLRWLSVLLALTFVAAACGDDDDSAGDDGGSGDSGLPAEIVLASPMPLSGPAAQTGQVAEAGAKFAADVVNESGILGDTKLVVRSADDQSDPSAGVRAVNQLYSDGLRLFAGGVGSGTNEAMLNALASRDDVLWVGCGCSTAAIHDEYGDSDWVFFSYPAQRSFVEVMREYADQLDPAPERVAIVYENSGNGAENGSLGKELFGGAYDIVADIAYDATATDLSPVVTEIKESNPDLIIATTKPADAILLIRQMREQGVDEVADYFMTNASAADDSVVEGAGPDIDGQIFSAGWDPAIAQFPASEEYPEIFTSTEDWTAAFTEATGEPANLFAYQLGYMPVAVIGIAIAETGSVDPGVLSDWLATELDTMSAAGPLRFEQTEAAAHHAYNQIFLAQFQDLTKVLIYPDAGDVQLVDW